MYAAPTGKRLIFYVFIVSLIINFISSGGHTDLWDGMVTFLITEGMALKQTAQLDPEIPSISNASIYKHGKCIPQLCPSLLVR